MMNLNQLSYTIFQGNKEKGFWDQERNIGELLMLVTTELAEALEAHRKGRMCLVNPRNILPPSIPEMNAPAISDADYAIQFAATIKDTFEDEIADAIIRLLDMCGGLNIDIDAHIQAKMKYNRTRPRLHGKAY
jgi:NTP pyrophosphatase (non-canonical NTP hydrolase)